MKTPIQGVILLAEKDMTKIQQDGMARSETRGILKTLVELVKDGILTLADAAGRANMTVEEFEIQSGLKA